MPPHSGQVSGEVPFLAPEPPQVSHFSSRWTVICWPYLNKFITAGTAPWILLDSKYNEQYGGAVWNDRIPLAVRSTIDENTDANVWRGRSRWNATFNDWRFAAIGGISTGEELPD